MTVDVGFRGQKPTLGPIAARRSVTAVNTSGAERGRFEALMESRRMANKYKNDLEAAMAALSAANSDIDRLNGEVDRLEKEVAGLNEELKRERDRNGSAPSRKSRKQSQKQQEPEKETEKEIVPENPPCDPELPFD